MIDIDLKSISYSAQRYAFSVGGNDGEEELIIVTSPGQNGATPVVIVAASCDGGADVYSVKDWVPLAKTGKYIRKALMQWATAGIKPNKDEAKTLGKKVDKVVGEFEKYLNGA